MLRAWIIYGVVFVFTALLNRIHPGYISGLSFYIILMVPIISLIHVSITYSAFKLIHKVDRREVSKGDKIVYNIKLINTIGLLMAPFSLHFFASDRLFGDTKFEEDKKIIVEGKRQVTLRKSLVCNYRGNYAVGVDCITITDYFGLFKLKYRGIEQHKILVYPKLRELKSNLLRNVINESSESIVSMDAANQSVFSDIREFQPGDPLNRIHWKLSAKQNTLLSKEYSGQMTNKTVVLLDTYNLGLGMENGIIYEDYLVEGCVSLIHFLLESRVHTTLYYKKLELKVLEGNTSSDFSKYYDDLARLTFHSKDNFVELVSSIVRMEQESCHFVIMTHKLSSDLVDILVRLKYMNFEISVIIIDLKYIELKELEKFVDNQSMFVLTSSGIPVYYLQHGETTTRLEVS